MNNEIYKWKSVFRLVVLMLMCLVLSKGTFAQSKISSSEPPGSEKPKIPDGAIFYEAYEIVEQTEFLIPDKSVIDVMTEWDWIEMESHKETRRHQSHVDENYNRYSKIKIVETGAINEWDHQIGHMTIDPEHSVVYNTEGAVISDLAHSKEYLIQQDLLKEEIKNVGFQPKLPFTSYKKLPVEEIKDEGYIVEETDYGYHIWNNLEEIKIHLDSNVRTYRALWEEYDIPYYIYENYGKSSQGYLFPVFKQEKTKILTENGGCVVKVHTETFRDYDLYYDPPAIAKEEEPTVHYNFSIYPNPADDYAGIKYDGNAYPSHSYELSIYNQINELVMDLDALGYNLNTEKVERIDISGLPSGFYFFRISIEKHVFTKKIFKK